MISSVEGLISGIQELIKQTNAVLIFMYEALSGLKGFKVYLML